MSVMNRIVSDASPFLGLWPLPADATAHRPPHPRSSADRMDLFRVHAKQYNLLWPAHLQEEDFLMADPDDRRKWDKDSRSFANKSCGLTPIFL